MEQENKSAQDNSAAKAAAQAVVDAIRPAVQEWYDADKENRSFLNILCLEDHKTFNATTCGNNVDIANALVSFLTRDEFGRSVMKAMARKMTLHLVDDAEKLLKEAREIAERLNMTGEGEADEGDNSQEDDDDHTEPDYNC